MPPTVQTEIGVMIAVLIGAWIVKVIGVAAYISWSRRRLARRSAALNSMQEDSSATKPAPSAVIAALPVIPYSQIALMRQLGSSSGSSDGGSSGSSTDGSSPSVKYSGQEDGRDMQEGVACSVQAQPQQEGKEARCMYVQVDAATDDTQQGRDQDVSCMRAEPGGMPCRTHAGPSTAATSTHALGNPGGEQEPGVPVDAGMAGSGANSSGGGAAGMVSSGVNRGSSSSSSASGAPGEDEADACAICFCEYEPHEFVKQLPCRHFYHQECIDIWLHKQNCCPLCKSRVWGADQDTASSQQQQQWQQDTQDAVVVAVAAPAGDDTASEAGGAATASAAVVVAAARPGASSSSSCSSSGASSAASNDGQHAEGAHQVVVIVQGGSSADSAGGGSSTTAQGAAGHQAV